MDMSRHKTYRKTAAELDNSEIDCDEDLCYFDDDASIESSMNDENNDIESDLSN